jgi:glycosyltransferase involved in cell wall biosynthesis
VHFGRLRRYKGVDIVLRAFVRIRERIPNARLVVIGDGPDLPRLRRVAASLNLGESVEFAGHVSTDKMVEMINRSHLFLNASPKEGWGLTVVEANACGVPVVGSDRPGLRDSILHDKTGYLVDYGDDAAMAERAVELLGDRELWQRFSAAGLEWARSMTWERCADEMEALFLREARL